MRYFFLAYLLVALIVVGRRANVTNDFELEKAVGSILVILCALTVVYGIFKLKAMQAEYDANKPPKLTKHHADEIDAT